MRHAWEWLKQLPPLFGVAQPMTLRVVQHHTAIRGRARIESNDAISTVEYVPIDFN